MDIFVRIGEGCDASFVPLWDSVFDDATYSADWALAGPTETYNRGGLQATAALATSVILALFTDKRCPPNHPLAKYADPHDLRGWWGDGIDIRADLGEAPMGSLLWLLERSVATIDMVRWAESLALDALACLVSQRAVAKVTAVAALLPARNGVTLDIGLYGQDGTTLYARQFAVVWRQIDASPPPAPLGRFAPLPATLSGGAGVDLGLASNANNQTTNLGRASDPTTFVVNLGDVAQ